MMTDENVGLQQPMVDEDEYEAEMKAKVAQMKKAQRKVIANAAAAAEVRATREAAREAEQREKAEAEARAWAEAKEAVAARAAEAAKKEEAQKAAMSAGDVVLMAIDTLAAEAAANEEHAERMARLEKVLGPAADSMRQRARRKSKDLQAEIARLMDGKLEEAFRQFDTDGSGALDEGELAAAYAAAGVSISEEKVRKCMKMLDSNGDGVIDLDEFKSIAVKMKMLD
jgi:hypothetical protein